jgi:hypothetical protein
MTREAYNRQVWQWRCDVCDKWHGRPELTQSELPSMDEMIAAGWSLGKVHGDACPECIAGGWVPRSERWTPRALVPEPHVSGGDR